jgi:hypothetical protein
VKRPRTALRAREHVSIRPQRPTMVRAGEKTVRESVFAIRAKNRFWRAAMRRDGSAHENFFIAKIRDSESALSAFSRHR